MIVKTTASAGSADGQWQGKFITYHGMLLQFFLSIWVFPSTQHHLYKTAYLHVGFLFKDTHWLFTHKGLNSKNSMTFCKWKENDWRSVFCLKGKYTLSYNVSLYRRYRYQIAIEIAISASYEIFFCFSVLGGIYLRLGLVINPRIDPSLGRCFVKTTHVESNVQKHLPPLVKASMKPLTTAVLLAVPYSSRPYLWITILNFTHYMEKGRYKNRNNWSKQMVLDEHCKLSLTKTKASKLGWNISQLG